ncbi:MAG: anti-sigma factor [Burkholderiales bacterium]|nr:anti-sigma factor [Burkholderiales bacterium]MDE2628935.1 anti-sigma factor [Burkholderiales bacterium]
MDYSRPELADRLAAEYVSGVLRGPARRRFEALLPAHVALREAVRAWQERLMPLTAVIAPQQPSPEVWKRIEARLHGTATAATAAAQARTPWWRQLAFWRGFSALASVATLALAVMLANPGPVRPPIVVVLSAATPAPGAPAGAVEPASFVASISADGRAMVTKPLVNVSLQANRSLELWSLPPSGAPRSLGVIAADRATVVNRGEVLEGTDKLAVTLEAAGGSPDGKPHGPVLYVGKLTL